jgi:NAD(P)-dependent dehydrogenase (short-subunit alcohol dehydrogenase family)
MKGTTPMSKVWFITGSSRGLGRSLAEAVLAHGDLLVATARNPEQLGDLVSRYGERMRAVALDVTNPEQVRTAIATAIDAFGRIDVVVNNAGYANVASIEDASEEDWRAQIETNLWGVINVTRAALPILRKQRSGHIVQVSSIGGRTGSAGLGDAQFLHQLRRQRGAALDTSWIAASKPGNHEVIRIRQSFLLSTQR